MGYYLDRDYLLIVLPFIILSVLASINVNRTFKKYSKQMSSRRITGAQAAARILQSYGIQNVRIERINGNLNDHYDPAANVIRLSNSVHDNTSTAAIGVACHEAGHAIQYAQNYAPIRMRSSIVPLANFGSRLAMPLIFIGILLSSLGRISVVFINIGIVFFAFSLLFQLITLPVEFNASRRALGAIEQADLLTSDELVGARKTLRAAALTYVAAAAVSFAQLLRLIIEFGAPNGKRRH